MPQQYEAQVLYRPDSDALRFLPEGPYTCAGGKLSWVAIQHGADSVVGSLNIYDFASGENISHPLDGRPGFAFPTDQANVFVVGMERSVRTVNLETGESTLVCGGIDADVENTIINDGVAFSEGLVFGAKHLEFSDKRAGLYYWRRRDRRLIQLRNEEICSNGKVVYERDGKTLLIDIDSPTKTVVEYPFDSIEGRLGKPRIVVDLRDGDVFPDGMVITPDGQSVIFAIYNPSDAPHGEARQYRIADGQLQAVWTTPGSPQVTCPQLVTIDGRVELILTTAIEHMPPERQEFHSNAGAIFHAVTSFEFASPQPVFSID